MDHTAQDAVNPFHRSMVVHPLSYRNILSLVGSYKGHRIHTINPYYCISCRNCISHSNGIAKINYSRSFNLYY